jgi:hypothetical protein
MLGDFSVDVVLLATDLGDIGFARMAWFIDPAKNCLGIMQLR